MNVNLEQIEQGFLNWYSKEIAPMSHKVLAVSPLILIAISNFKKRNVKMISYLLDEEGLIDVDVLHKEYSAILTAQGSWEVMGIKFNTQDIDKLVEYIKNVKAVTVPSPPVVTGGTI